jgi:hypothetical protein
MRLRRSYRAFDRVSTAIAIRVRKGFGPEKSAKRVTPFENSQSDKQRL